MAAIEATEAGGEGVAETTPLIPEGTPSQEGGATEEVTEEPDGQGSETVEEAGEGNSGADDRALMDYFEKNYGLDMSKYGTSKDLLHGMANAMQLVGQRNEDAQWAAKYKPYQEQLDNILAGKKEEEPAKPGSDEPEWSDAWEVLAEKNQLPPDLAAKYNAHVKWERNKLKQIVNDPESVFGKMLDERLGNRVSEIEAQSKQMQETLRAKEQQAEIDAWNSRHAADLYIKGLGSELSPLGKKAAELYQDNFVQKFVENYQQNPQLAMSELAVRLARADMPKPNGTLKTPQSAVRKPNLASGGKEPKSATEEAIEQIDAGESLTSVLMKLGQATSE
jgi:hypothetical protein